MRALDWMSGGHCIERWVAGTNSRGGSLPAVRPPASADRMARESSRQRPCSRSILAIRRSRKKAPSTSARVSCGGIRPRFSTDSGRAAIFRSGCGRSSKKRPRSPFGPTDCLTAGFGLPICSLIVGLWARLRDMRPAHSWESTLRAPPVHIGGSQTCHRSTDC